MKRYDPHDFKRVTFMDKKTPLVRAKSDGADWNNRPLAPYDSSDFTRYGFVRPDFKPRDPRYFDTERSQADLAQSIEAFEGLRSLKTGNVSENIKGLVSLTKELPSNIEAMNEKQSRDIGDALELLMDYLKPQAVSELTTNDVSQIGSIAGKVGVLPYDVLGLPRFITKQNYELNSGPIIYYVISQPSHSYKGRNGVNSNNFSRFLFNFATKPNDKEGSYVFDMKTLSFVKAEDVYIDFIDGKINPKEGFTSFDGKTILRTPQGINAVWGKKLADEAGVSLEIDEGSMPGPSVG